MDDRHFEPPPAPVPNGELFSRATLLDRIDNDINLFVELLRQFREHLPAQIGEMQAAFVRGDPGGISAAAHTLKGTAANLAFDSVRCIAADIETTARHGELGGIQEMLARLETAADRLGAVIDAEIAGVRGQS